MEFELEDVNENIDKRTKKLTTVSLINIEQVRDRINEEMKAVTIEFREKQNKSLESASRAFLTF